MQYATILFADQRYPVTQPNKFCSFAEDAVGEIYVLLLDGKIYQVTAL